MLNKLLSFILPESCFICEEKACRDYALCETCKTLLITQDQDCQRCGMLLAINESLCGKCLSSPPDYDEIHFVGRYRSFLKKMILHFKLNHSLFLGRTLSTLFVEKIKLSQILLPEVIIPVPLHKNRLRERGFNQTVELARPICKELSIKLDLTSCIRQKQTAPQSQLNAKKRRSNINNAFKLIKPIDYQRVVVLDDIVTTGETANELCRLLRKAGVSHISVWCIAKT